MRATKQTGAGYCMWTLCDTTSSCSGSHWKMQVWSQQTLPDCTDDSEELQNYLYRRLIRGWFMATGRRALSRERTRAVPFSELASKNMSHIHTELWPAWVATMLWSVETGCCTACLNRGGLDYFRNCRAAHSSYPYAVSCRRKVWTGTAVKLPHGGEMQQVLLYTLHEHGPIRRQDSYLRN